jgi:hypothetical protein
MAYFNYSRERLIDNHALRIGVEIQWHQRELLSAHSILDGSHLGVHARSFQVQINALQ